MLCLCGAAGAQTYDKVLRRNFWNDGNGVVGMRQDSVSVAVAELSGGYEDGGLRSASQAASAWTAGARSAAIRHLKNFSVAGSLSFEQFWGSGMAGSMFVRPGFFPIDVYEFTPADKRRQTYAFSGAVSVDVGAQWRLGAGVEFTSANLAKLKDLRHTTYMLDFRVNPGVQYHNGDFALGLNGIFSKTSETATAEQIGSKVASYEVFLNKGLYYGVGELWTGSGVHLSEAGVSGFPLSQTSGGVSLQASYGSVYASLSWTAHSGFCGEKDKLWYRFAGSTLGVNLGARFPSALGTHSIRGSAEFFSQTNNETVLERVNEGGVTTTVELGANQVLLRTRLKASLDYDFAGKGWSLGASASFVDNEGVQSGLYPYVGTQVLRTPFVSVRGGAGISHFDLRLGIGYTAGIMEDTLNSVDASSGVSGEPERLDSYFVKFRDQMTAHQIVVTPVARFNFCRVFYLEAGAVWVHGFNLQYLGSNRINASLKFGYNF